MFMQSKLIDRIGSMDQMDQELEINIDFDQASKEWRKNKKPYGDGAFKYVCGYMKSNGKPCQRPPQKGKSIGHCVYHIELNLQI